MTTGEVKDYTEIDVGEYQATLESAQTTLSRNEKMRMELVFAFEGGALRRTIYLYLDGTNIQLDDGRPGYSIQKLQSLGWNGSLDAPEFDKVKSTDVWLRCKHEVFEGANREKWDLRDWGDGPTLPAADALKRKQAEINALLGLNKPKPPTTPPPSAPPARSAPPPVPPKQPVNTRPACPDEQAAWEMWVDAFQPKQPDAAAWNQAIEEVQLKHKKDREAFGEAEWTEVGHSSPPF